MPLPISDLIEVTELNNTDVMHLRTQAHIDNKITVANLIAALGIPAFPTGAIIMFDANNAGGGGDPTGESGAWVDNETMPNWFACISGNSDHGCPNMVDKFVMGKVIAGAGGSGGSNVLIDHTHASGNQSASHTHTVKIRNNDTGNTLLTSAAAWSNGVITSPVVARHGHTSAANTSRSLNNNQSASHSHVIGSGSVPGSTNSRPSYYSIIFIRKCA